MSIDTMPPFAIHWFRRDLRIAGNQALKKLLTRFPGRVLCLFCVDKNILSRPDISENRFAFLLHTLHSLKEDLNKLGGDLFVLNKEPTEAFTHLIQQFHSDPNHKLAAVSWNRDYEPFARKRDESIAALLKNHQIDIVTERDHLIFEPTDILKENGEPYRVFTPYLRRWVERIQTESSLQRVSKHVNDTSFYKLTTETRRAHFPFQLQWQDVLKAHDALDGLLNGLKTSVPMPQAGTNAAFEALQNFKPQLKDYMRRRDLLGDSGTSRLSVYLKNGSLTTAQVIAALDLENFTQGTFADLPMGAQTFLKELVWREFYYAILFQFPHVERGCFNAQYDALTWENSETKFLAWCEGKTGFPVVDAAMRQLNTTGWMHNRARMIVASFLTKDLLIDWRWGERYFMSKLLDGDLAANNGGWQWAASTGCDAQPYFRIFNPELQSKKFDPTGTYIKTYVPELRAVSVNDIHALKKERPANYPMPIVNHSAQAQRAKMLFSRIK